jgi:hypothetical protein
MLQKDVTIDATANSIRVTVTVRDGPGSYPASTAKVTAPPAPGPPTVTGNASQAVYTFAPLNPGKYIVNVNCSESVFGRPVQVGAGDQVRFTMQDDNPLPPSPPPP